MRNTKLIIIALSLVFAAACNPSWEDYYDSYPETVNENLWMAMQADESISNFVQILKDYKLDTLFNSDIPYTVFAPTNEATDAFIGSIDSTLLKYHFCTHVINVSNIVEKRKVQTLTQKFALFDRKGMVVLIDGVEIETESPLYLNGRYLRVNNVIEPKPNLYEFYRSTNPILSVYIDSHDSIFLDKTLSIPVGYDDDDNTIYDSVITLVNTFELEFFEVKQEFRDRTATIVFPLEEDYLAALDVMATNLGYTDHNDIPLDWQNTILLPYLINKGIFKNMLEPDEFVPDVPKLKYKMVNILGDSVLIDYTLGEQSICSNGYAYNYESFEVLESLYIGEQRFEGEYLTDERGENVFAWSESAIVESTFEFIPGQQFRGDASNDSIVKVLFPNGYDGEWSIEFQSPKLFPRKYVMEMSTHMGIGGIYDIYVNDELMRTFDYNEFTIYNGFVLSVEPNKIYKPSGPSEQYNSFDMFVDNVETYGRATIRIDYKGPGTTASNGFYLDYLEFRPTEH